MPTSKDLPAAAELGDRERPFVVITDEASISLGLTELLIQLNQARKAFHGETSKGRPDRLAAAALALNGLARLLMKLDPSDSDGYRALVVEAARGLFDIHAGNQPPEWLNPPRKWDRRPDASEKWARRASAAIVFEWMGRCGVSKKLALAEITSVLIQHGINSVSADRVFTWVRAFRGGKTPRGSQRHYQAQISLAPPVRQPSSPPEAMAELNHFLSSDLAARGHPKGVAIKSP